MQPASLTTELLTAQVRFSRRPLTWAGRCVGCSWIQLDFAGLHGQDRAIARRGGEVIREVGQCQLQRGAPAVLLNHAVQLQLGGPVEHLTPICARKASRVKKRPPMNVRQRQQRPLLPWPTSWISVTDSVDIFCTAACHNETNVYLKNSQVKLTCLCSVAAQSKRIFCGRIVPPASAFNSLI